MEVQTIVIVTIAVALIFDVINGFHDAANSIATVVSTRVLSPKVAVLWAATFNFVALFIFHEGVANTISKTIEIQQGDPAFVWVVICGLIGAILWNLLTWWLGTAGVELARADRRALRCRHRVRRPRRAEVVDAQADADLHHRRAVDRPRARRAVDVGRVLAVPTHATDARSTARSASAS